MANRVRIGDFLVCALCAGALLIAGRALAAPAGADLLDGGSPCVQARLEVQGLSLVHGTVLDGAGGAGGASPSARRDERSPILALLMSCVLPGWGEMYTGHAARGRAFMAAEASIWAAYAGFRIQTGMREDDYREHAEIFAGVPDGASNAYYQAVADYIRSEGYDSYNESVRSDARSLFPNDPAAQQAYLAEHGYFGDDAWEWESDERFRQYRRLRQLAGEARRRAFYMTGLAVLNRAVSAIDSAWMARRANEGRAEARASLSVVPELADGDVGARTTLEIRF
ncbi:MAG: hypothetical protein FJY74_00065 [Candidatus Eisenbacteria bacterium]|nr:hypothetical protein [Candidatus Eisenbacteria bacterium]